MALLALSGSFLVAAGGAAQAQTTGATARGAAVSTVSTPTGKPSPAEGHSPELNQKLSGPLSGTGPARPGTTVNMPATVRQNTAAAASTQVSGIDVASGQHPNGNNSDINWTSVAGAGYQFAAIKATEANYYTNPFYVYDAQNAVSNGMYVAPYAFVNAFNATDATGGNGTPASQADDAVTEAAKAENATTYTVGGKYLPIMLDIEYDPYAGSEGVNSCYGLSASAMVSFISAFNAEIKAKTGHDPIIYTTTDWWSTCTGNSSAFGSDVLWIADYASGSPGTLPAGWNTWNMWQYSDGGSVSGISGKVDLDTFSGAPQTMSTKVNTAATPAQVRTLSGLAGQSETYTATGLPPGTSISSSGLISGTPTTPGTYTVTVTPSGSGTVLPASISFTWTVTGSPITMTSPGNQSTTIGSSVGIQVAATDSSGATPTFTATGLPPGTSISSSGQITGWPNAPGTYSTVVTATDSAGASASVSFTWTVAQASDSGPTGAVSLSSVGKCLDDTNYSTTNGNRIQIYNCNGTTAQSWTFAQDGTLRVLGKCLDVYQGGTSDGTPVQLYSCLAGDANQRWQLGTDGELLSASGACLDDPSSSATNGTKMDISACTGGANQHWTLPAGPVVSGLAGKCLDDFNYATTNGNKIQVYNCNGTTAQTVTVEPDGTLRVLGSCLDVYRGGTTSGTPVQLYSCLAGDANQQWQFVSTGPLAGEVVNPQSNLCLADPGDAGNGTQLVIQSCSATDPGTSWRMS